MSKTVIDEIRVTDNFLRLAWDKLDRTKSDLDKNWLEQVAVITINICLMFGLGEFISEYLFHEKGHEDVLYLDAPIFWLYLFTRFGALLTAFREARDAFEILTKYYVSNNNLPVNPIAIYRTGSFFEGYYRKFDFVSIMYCFLVALVASSGHGSSIYLLHKNLNNDILREIFIPIYILPIITLNLLFYFANRTNSYTFPSLILSALMTNIWVWFTFL